LVCILKKYLLISFAILLFVLSCQANSQPSPSQKIAISYVIYPQVEPYVDLIEEIYTELGFKVTMIPTPSTRGLVMLNEGRVDADVVRLKQTAKAYPQVILVEPALKNAKLVLLCIKDIICDQSALKDRKVVILSNDGVDPYITDLNISARIENPQGTVNILDMLKAKRANYGFFLMDGKTDFTQDFQMWEIKEISVYHVIHKKHADLLPLIQQKLFEKLPAFNETQS
jgi:hypothetical protein